MRTLAVVAGAGIVTSIACLSLANAIDPSVYTMDRHGFVFAGCTVPADNSTNGTRELAWNGDSVATINVPATVHYRPGAGSTVHASGPNELMSHLRVREGRIELDCNLSGFDRELDLVLPGRAFHTFTLNGTPGIIGLVLLVSKDPVFEPDMVFKPGEYDHVAGTEPGDQGQHSVWHVTCELKRICQQEDTPL